MNRVYQMIAVEWVQCDRRHCAVSDGEGRGNDTIPYQMKLTDYTSWLLPIWYLVSPKLGLQIKSQQMTFVEVNILIISMHLTTKMFLLICYW